MPWEISPDETPATRPTGWWVSPSDNQQSQGISWDDEKHWEIDLLLALNFVNPLDLLKIATLSQPNPFAFTAGALAEMVKIAPVGLSRPVTLSATLGLGFNYAGLPTLTTISTAGAYSYTIPRNCNTIDVILLGGGGGGGSSNFFAWGGGGNAGSRTYVTLQRGVDIPWSATVITGSVGSGGASNTNGSATSASASGWAGTSASGGTKGAQDSNGPAGSDTPGGTLSLHSQSYPPGIGGKAGDPQTANAAYGSGGCGGKSNFGYGPGTSGRQGAAWFYAYQ